MTSYNINFPSISDNTYSFFFTSSVGGSSWSFEFIYINSRWTCYATPPDDIAREATVYNGVLNWDGYPDYGCIFISNKDIPGLNDISSVSLYIIDWRP